MAFRDLFWDFEGSGRSLQMQQSEKKDSEVMPMPRAETLVNNRLDHLEKIPHETRKKIKFLFVLAHPDDESSHLVYLKVLTELGFPVQITWLTYGDGSIDIETKKSESIKVLSSIPGIEKKFLPNKVMDVVRDIFKNSSKDQQIRAIDSMIQQVRGDIREASVVITNAFEGGHLLHDFTSLLTRTVAQDEGKEVLEIPQYSIKKLTDMVYSAVRSLLNFQWGEQVFYNVGEFREGLPKDEEISIPNPHAELKLPAILQLTNTATTSKAGLIRLYKSQWENVFSKLLEVVEFNKSEDRELLRKAKKIPGLYEGLMHLEKIVKSWFGMVVHPKKLYEVKDLLEAAVKKTTTESVQQ